MSREVDWYSFLDRPRLNRASEKLLQRFSSASILVTGAAGSIGSALALRLATIKPRRLVLLDASEQSLYKLQMRLNPLTNLDGSGVKSNTVFYLGNAGDASVIDEILSANQPQYIFHAAAYKHVPLLEEHPLAALQNNALVTLALMDCLTRHQTSHPARLILLSTDKACDPASILGASKRIAEKIVTVHGGIAVRLGNVLGSKGSVVELFVEQIANRLPLTITDPNAERYFLTEEEAVDLLLSVAVSSEPGTIVAPQLNGPHKILGLAHFLRKQYSADGQLPSTYTGLRPGDKRCETLWASDEQVSHEDESGCLVITQPPFENTQLQHALSRLHVAIRDRALDRSMQIVAELVPTYKSNNVVAHPVEASSR